MGGLQRLGAATAHLLAPIGLPIIGPLSLCGARSSAVRRNAVAALNFQLSVLGATFLLPLTIIGVVLLPVIWVGVRAIRRRWRHRLA